MRKILLLLVLMVAMSATCQTVARRKTIKSINFGVLKLERFIVEQDTTYAMWIKTTNRYVPSFTVSLGHRDEAIRQLNFLINVELKDDDEVYMDNDQHTRVGRGMFGSLCFWSEGEAFSGDVGKMYLKKFVEALDGNVDEGDKPKERKKKKKGPAYMRNYGE